MIKSKSEINIDLAKLEKINVYKFPIDNDKVPNITNQIIKRLEMIKSEKEKLMELSFVKNKKFLFNIPKKKITRSALSKRKTKKTKKYRPSTIENFNNKKLNILDLFSSNKSLNKNKSNKSLFNLKNNSPKYSIFSKFQKKSPSKFRKSDFFITEDKSQKGSLLNLTSNFSRNNSEYNIFPTSKYEVNDSFNSEELKIISNSNSNSFFNESIDFKTKKKILKSESLQNLKLKKNNIPHPIYKHLNVTLENAKKIKNEIVNASKSFSHINPYNNTENNIIENNRIKLEKPNKIFIYNLGYYLSSEPKLKNALSSTKTISALNPVSSYLFKDEIGKEMEIKIKFEPLDKIKFTPNKFYDNAFKKPKWVDERNLKLKDGFKLIFNQIEKNRIEVKKIKRKHNI